MNIFVIHLLRKHVCTRKTKHVIAIITPSQMLNEPRCEKKSCHQSHQGTMSGIRVSSSLLDSLSRASGQLGLERLRKSFFLTLPLHFHQVLSVPGSRVVDATFRLRLALPTTSPLVLVLPHRLRRVPVSNALVAAVQQLIVRHVVFLDVLPHLVEGPVSQGVDLDETGFVDLNNIKFTPFTALAATAARQDRIDIQFPVGTLSRFDLGSPIVTLVVRFPQTLAVLLSKLLCCLDASRLEDVNVDVRISLAHPINEGKRLWEVMKGVEEDQVHHLRPGDLQLGEHISNDKTAQAKGRGLIEIW